VLEATRCDQQLGLGRLTLSTLKLGWVCTTEFRQALQAGTERVTYNVK
jgi:hypothetical protein